MSNKTQKVENTSTQQLDPRMASYLFGSDSNGQMSNYVPKDMPGLFASAMELYNKGPAEYYSGDTYAGLNDTQKGALSSLLDYYKSPESMAGADAAKSLGGALVNQPGTTFDRFSALPQLDKSNQITAPTMAQPAPIQAASVGTSGVDWKTAIQNTLKGEVNNPYLSQISGNIGRSASDNYLRNIAPQISGGAQLAGQFGGSRHGVVEANALRDLNRGVSDSVANLYGSAYENAQNAKNASALALSGQESGERVSQAQISQQAALAQAQIQAQKDMANAQLAYQAQRDNQLASLQLGGLALQDKIGTGNLNLAADNQNTNQQLAGVGLLQQASQQPVTNAQGVLGIGALQQQEAQNQINADKARWDYGQNAGWQNLNNISGLLTGNATLGASQTGTQGQFYNPTMQWMGALGGMVNAAGGASGIAAAMSDKRVKKDIQRIGETSKGFPLYLFRYLWDSANESPRIGVMAQDVEQTMPEAVITRPDGVKTVNYAMVM